MKTPVSVSHTEGKEEQWPPQAALWSRSQKEVSLAAVRLSHTRAGLLLLLGAGSHGSRAAVRRRSRPGRVLPHRERDAGSHGHGASAQKVWLAGSQLLRVSTSSTGLLVLTAGRPARTQAIIPREVSLHS